jgi:hypothetical protein
MRQRGKVAQKMEKRMAARAPSHPQIVAVLCSNSHQTSVSAGRRPAENGGMARLPLPDEQPIAVNALRNMRARIAGEIEMHNREIDRLRAELVHLDATMRLFDLETDPSDIPALRRIPDARNGSRVVRSRSASMKPSETARSFGRAR